MKLQVFNGGINNGIARNLIPQNEAINLQNVDVATAILAPLKDSHTVASLPNKERYGYYFKDSYKLAYVAPINFARFKSTLLSSLDGVLQILDADGFTASPHSIDHWSPVIIGTPSKIDVEGKFVGTPIGATPQGTHNDPDYIELDECLRASIQVAGATTSDGTMTHTAGEIATYRMYITEQVDGVIPNSSAVTIPDNYADNLVIDVELSPLGDDGCVVDIDVYIHPSDTISIRTATGVLVWESSENLNKFSGEHLVAKVTIDSPSAKILFTADGSTTSSGGTITATRMNPELTGVLVSTYWDSLQIAVTSASAVGGILIDLNVLDIRFTEAHPNASMQIVAYKENVLTVVAQTSLSSAGHFVIEDTSDTISGRPPFINYPLSRREAGNFVYAITSVDSRGYESNPIYSSEVTIDKGGVVVLRSDIYWEAPLNIYRIGGAIDVFTLVASEWKGGTFIDYTHSGDLEIAVLETQDNLSSMDVEIMTVHNSVVWASSGHTLRFSDINREWSWNAFSWLKFKEPITGMITTRDGLFVSTVSTVSIVLGDSRESIAIMELSDKIGCTHHNTLKDYKGTLFFLSRDGIYQLSGTTLACITAVKLPNFIAPADLDYIPAGDTYYENISNPTGYGMVYNDQYWLQNKYDFLVYDIKRRVFSTYRPADRGLLSPMLSVMGQSEYIYGLKGVMFIWEDVAPNDTAVNETCTPTNPYDKSEMVMFYRSPVFTEGEYTNHKIYDNFFVAYSGELNIAILIDDENRGNFLIGVAGDTTKKVKEIRVPVEYKRGYSIQFEVNGTGTLYELVYNILPKQGGA